MTPARARAIRGERRWGEQGGLLSIAEMICLANLTRDYGRVLEVGHYYGLSTRCIADDAGVAVLTVDSHDGDRWVPDPAGVDAFLKNVGERKNILPLFMSSLSLHAPLAIECVFYDGDHGDEQVRFTQAVIDSPLVQLFVFDDRDFPHPMRCEEMLQAAKWVDWSPPLYRGERDKQDEKTMTLGVWRRP